MRVAMLPARSGSKRLSKKNYLKFGGKTVLELGIEKAIRSDAFDRIVINSDDSNLADVSNKWGVDFYLRPPELATDFATSDQVVLDFLKKFAPTSLYWINTASPLSKTSDVATVASKFEDSGSSATVTGNSKYVHAMHKGLPLNFSFTEREFARTQDIEPVFLLNYAVMGWKMSAAESLECGTLFPSDTLFVETSEEASFLLKTSEDYGRLLALSCRPGNEV